MNSHRFGFLGGGQMATAIARGAISAKIASDSDISFFDTNAKQGERLRELFPNATFAKSPKDLFEQCDKIVLAVKPQVLQAVSSELRSLTTPAHLLVSIAAGISLSKLTDWFSTTRFIRVMPNTPCQSLQGASGIARASGVTDDDMQWCNSIFTSVGKVVHVSDEQLHAVTGVSGSGPAYVLMIIEALSDGGVMAGLSRESALALATQTVLGTATMVQETGLHPAVLREQVTSPGGTTIAAIHSLEQNRVRAAMIEAVAAAVKRSRELGA